MGINILAVLIEAKKRDSHKFAFCISPRLIDQHPIWVQPYNGAAGSTD